MSTHRSPTTRHHPITDPPRIVSGKGSRLSDADGRDYIDFTLNHGSLILGHAHRNVILALKKHLERGTGFGISNPAEIYLIRQIRTVFQDAEDAVFVTAPSQALSACLQRAREHTGRDMILTNRPYPINGCVTTQPNDPAVLTRTIQQNKNRIAGILLDPLITDEEGLTSIDESFLRTARDLADAHGALLILDESLRGFRSGACHPSPADVCVLAGIMSAGLPLAGVIGRRDHITAIRTTLPNRERHITPAILRASLMTLKLLDERLYRGLEERADALEASLAAALRNHAPHIGLDRWHAMMMLTPATESAGKGPLALLRLYPELRSFLLHEGIVFPETYPSAFFLSIMHTKKDIERLSTAVHQFFKMSNGKTGS